MRPEFTLTLYDLETGRKKRINLDSRRFTIGRLLENDLAIDDPDLSRRHAIIESFEGSVLISDCGSQNGTHVNGQRVAGSCELYDGDVITFGGAKEITVEMAHAPSSRSSVAGALSPVLPDPATADEPVQRANTNNPLPQSMPTWLNAPVIAGAAAVLILLGTGLLLALKGGSSSAPSRTFRPPPAETQSSSTVSERATPPPEPDNDETPGNVTASLPGDSDELRIVEKNARIVMTGISNDNSPFLPSEVVSQINEKVKKYKGSTVLRDHLRIMKQRGVAELAAPAKSNDIKLSLAVFAALAKMDRDGERGDPVTVAQAMLPGLRKLAIIFGGELANDSLLVVATLDQPPTGNFHPLQLTISRLANDQHEIVTKIRTVWYLYDHQKISARAYDIVLRFLAIGVIAQDPHHFGVEADPLTFQ